MANPRRKQRVESPDRPVLRYVVLRHGAGWPQYLAAWVLMKFGGHHWKWYDDNPPQIIFVSCLDMALELYPCDKSDENSDTVWIGFGGGRFDTSHDTFSSGRATDADRMAEYLGVRFREEIQLMLDSCRAWVFGKKDDKRDPAASKDEEYTHRDMTFGRLLSTMGEYAVVADEDADGVPLSPMMKRTYRHEAALATAFRHFDAVFAKGHEFHVLCPRDFGQTGRMVTIGKLRVAFVESDLRAMSAWCRVVKKANVVVVRSIISGHTRVFTKDGAGRDEFQWIVQAVLEAEYEALELLADMDVLLDRLGQMCDDSVDGPLPGAPHWYVDWKNGWVLNGSDEEDPNPSTITFTMLEGYLVDILVNRDDDEEEEAAQ